jgi:hypothetical protein
LLLVCLKISKQVKRRVRKKGVKLLEAFYSNVSNKHYEKIDSMVADSLKKYVGKHGISKMIISLQNKVGVYKGYILISMTIKKAYYYLFY